MTLQDIRDEMVEEMGIDSDDSTALTKLFTCLKSAMRRLPQFVRARTLYYRAEVSLTAGNNSASLPSDFIEERVVWRKTAEGKRIDLTKLTTRRLNEENQDDSGSIYYYQIVGKTIYFDKKTVDDDTIYVEHTKSQTGTFELTTDFFGQDHEVETVKDLAKYRWYTDYEEDAAKAAEAKDGGSAGIAKMNEDHQATEIPQHVEESDT